MVSREDAHRAAEQVLAEIYGDSAVGSTVVINAGRITEVANAWVVAFDKTGVEADAPIPPGETRAIVVPKNGAPAHMPPSAFPLREYLSMVEAGERDWPAGR